MAGGKQRRALKMTFLNKDHTGWGVICPNRNWFQCCCDGAEEMVSFSLQEKLHEVITMTRWEG